MKLQHTLYGILLGGLVLLSSVFAQDASKEAFFYQTPVGTDASIQADGEDTINIAKGIKENSITDASNTEKKESLLYKIREYLRLTGKTYDNATPALSYIQMIINLILGLVSFISFILVIFAFYLIFFDKGEEGVKKAKKILSGVAIAILIMGLSRIIVGFLFNVYSTQAIKNL